MIEETGDWQKKVDTSEKISTDLVEEGFLEARPAFAGLYRDLQREGSAPDPETGAIQPPEHPDVDILPNGDVFGTYQELTAYLGSSGLTRRRGSELVGLEAHHLLEHRLMEPFGFSREEGLCVATFADEHMGLVHGDQGVDSHLPRGYRFNIQDVLEGHVQAYDSIGRPEWSEKAKGYVQENRDRIIAAYESGTVPWATEQSTAEAQAYLRSLQGETE